MLKEAVRKWANKIGSNEAKARLVRRGINGNTVDKLVAGTYESEPKGANATAIREEMAKDGLTVAIVVTDENEAS